MQHLADSRYAWTRLMVILLMMTIGSGAMYVIAVVLLTVITTAAGGAGMHASDVALLLGKLLGLLALMIACLLYTSPSPRD